MSCGAGERHRSVRCMQRIRYKPEWVASSRCLFPAPARKELCSIQHCPPMWSAGSWSEVNGHDGMFSAGARVVQKQRYFVWFSQCLVQNPDQSFAGKVFNRFRKILISLRQVLLAYWMKTDSAKFNSGESYSLTTLTWYNPSGIVYYFRIHAECPVRPKPSIHRK